jgi:hypothetical protein
MTKHVLFIAALAAAPFACTKTNPALCCTDEANCTSLGISDDHMCSDGLVCLGNQCIAETCASSTDCNASQPFCNSSQLCEATCDTSSECPGFGGSADQTICSSGACVQCVMSSDCSGTTPVCNTSSNSCVQCLANSDCTATDPVCSNNTCVGCGSDSDCASTICGSGGACVDPSAIVYLSPAGVDSGTCTQAAPCKTLDFGAAHTSDARSFISLLNGLYSAEVRLDTSVTSAANIDVHGNGSTLAPAPGNDGAFFETSISMTLRNLILDGTQGDPNATLEPGPAAIQLLNVTIKGGFDGINASGPISAQNLTVSDVDSIGITTSSSLTIDQAQVFDAVTAIAASGTSELTNMMVYGCSGTSVDLTNGNGTIEFSTIAGSGSSTSPGVICGNASLRAVIVWLTAASVPTEGCSSLESIVGPISVSGAMDTNPMFVDPTSNNFHLSSTSPAIDQVTSGPPVDFEGDSRPQGSGYDIGADEYKP